jgi:hypothetical protein
MIGFCLGVVGGILGDIMRERLRRLWERRILGTELRDELELLDTLLTAIMDQAKEQGELLGGEVGPAFSSHAKRDLPLAKDRFGRLLDRLHVLDDYCVRRQLREFFHLLHSTAIAVATLDDRGQYGLDIPNETERRAWEALWRESRRRAAGQCMSCLEELKDTVPSLLKSIPEQ